MKGVRGFRFGLCFLSVHFSGPKGGGFNVPFSEKKDEKIVRMLYFSKKVAGPSDPPPLSSQPQRGISQTPL